jgi:hypothetical protein
LAGGNIEWSGPLYIDWSNQKGSPSSDAEGALMNGRTAAGKKKL